MTVHNTRVSPVRPVVATRSDVALARRTGALKAVRDHLLWSMGRPVHGVFGVDGVIKDAQHLLDLVNEALV